MKASRPIRRPIFLALLLAGATFLANAQTPDRATALALEQQGHTAEAEQVWQSIANANPNNAEAFAHLGLLEAREGKYDLAITHDRRAQKLEPANPAIQLNLGLALFKAERFAEAASAFTAELKKHPGDQRLTILVAMSHYGLGDYLVAIPYLQQAAARDPQNLPLRLTLAHACMWSKQYQCVLDTEKEILTLNPNSAEADMLAGEALDEEGNSDGAVAQLRAAALANPKEPNVHFGLGYLLWKQSKFEEAIPEFKAELENNPSQVTARAYLADSYINLQQYDQAEPQLLRCAREDPSLVMVHRDLGILYVSTNRAAEAEKELKRAIELDASDVASHWRLAKLYQAAGRKDEARAEFAFVSKSVNKGDEALAEKIARSAAAKQ